MKKKWERFGWFLTLKIDFECQILALFDTFPLIQFSKFNNFLWVCWFLGKNISNFVLPAWKLHYRNYHNAQKEKKQGIENSNYFLLYPKGLVIPVKNLTVNSTLWSLPSNNFKSSKPRELKTRGVYAIMAWFIEVMFGFCEKKSQTINLETLNCCVQWSILFWHLHLHEISLEKIP